MLCYIQFKFLQVNDLLKYEIAKFAHCYMTSKTPIRSKIIFVKLLNIRSELQDNQVITRIFILHVTEQKNCKGALDISEARYGVPFLKKLEYCLIKDLKVSVNFFC